MSGASVGLIGIVVLLVLLAARMPVGFAMMAVGVGGVSYLYGGNLGPIMGTLGIAPYSTALNFVFTTIPLFILMGNIAFRSGVSEEMYGTARSWLGHWRGGLANATIGACAIFAAASGSSVATAAAMGTITVPEMRRHGVNARLASGVVAAGGTLGILIPPSLGMLIYAMVTDQSMGRLLLAGIVPGLLLTVMFLLTVTLWARLRPGDAPPAPRMPWRQRWRSLSGVAGIGVLSLLVMGGIYGGFATPTEAAAVGAFGSFVIAAFKRRLTWQAVVASLDDTVRTTCMVFMIIIGAHVLNIFLATTQVPVAISEALNGLPLSRHAILALVLLMYLVLGCFLDVLAMIVLTVPIVFPALMALGFDPIWFGVVIVLIMEMALITPPVGMNVYVIKGIAPDIPLHVIFAGIWPFLVAQIATLVLLVLMPDIALWLPSAAR
ncbi:MAG: TRAP transporter large permease [Burkholderiaceae bacterium]